MSKKFYTLCCSFSLLFLLVVWVIFLKDWRDFLKSSLISQTDKKVIYYLSPGTSLYMLAYDLKKKGILKNPIYFMLLAIQNPSLLHLKSGEYLLYPGIKPKDFLKQLNVGKTIYREITFKEGINFKELLAILNSNSYLLHDTRNLDTATIMKKIGYPLEYPEGKFFPSTYYFTAHTSDLIILKMAHTLMQQKLFAAWKTRNIKIPYTSPQEALIVASILEKEARLPQEKYIISDIIMRRLKKHMRLQIDATVIYGLGAQYTGSLNHLDLKINTPYNTYMHAGLPPTPIAMPGSISIDAALHPYSNPWWYFVSTGQGAHHFSINFKSHHTAIKMYHLKSMFKYKAA